MRFDLDGNEQPYLAYAKQFADAIHAKYPGKNVGLQLFAFVQLGGETIGCRNGNF
nr:hypothetical protein [Flavobacterium sp. LM5]